MTEPTECSPIVLKIVVVVFVSKLEKKCLIHAIRIEVLSADDLLVLLALLLSLSGNAACASTGTGSWTVLT